MIKLDPRTKLLLLLLVGIFVIGYIGGEEMTVLRLILTFLPFVLTLTQKKYKRAFSFLFLYVLCYVVQYYSAMYIKGGAFLLILLITGFFIRIMPAGLMGMYAITSTTISEFIASFERMHVTDKITIPLSVMFRFFPTVVQEFRSINEAMKMRDIKIGGSKVFKMIEYRIVPMMSCSVLIGEELSASALTRGLGGDVKRTNICTLKFTFWDYLLLAFSLFVIAYYIYTLFV